MTGNEKYSLPNRQNLPQWIEMQLSKKHKNFSTFLLQSWKLHQHIQNNIDMENMSLSGLRSLRNGS